MEFGQTGFIKFGNLDFVMLAKSFGAIWYKVNSTEEFSIYLDKAKKSTDTPIIIAADMDYTRNNILLNDEYCNLPSQWIGGIFINIGL